VSRIVSARFNASVWYLGAENLGADARKVSMTAVAATGDAPAGILLRAHDGGPFLVAEAPGTEAHYEVLVPWSNVASFRREAERPKVKAEKAKAEP
jgi:hypothetical protein